MILDASAIVAVLNREPEAGDLANRILAAPVRWTHALSLYETTLAIRRFSGVEDERASSVVRSFLSDLEIGVAEIGSAEAAEALDAHRRYGKGRHPARLNMGDCFSYACAKLRGMPLLYKGADFAQTDLA